MNEILELRKAFTPSNNSRGGGGTKLPNPTDTVKSEKVERLHEELFNIQQYWESNNIPFNPLVSIHYIRVLAKSNRAVRILAASRRVNDQASFSIVGAKFENTLVDGTIKKHHVITYCVTKKTISSTLELLDAANKIIKKNGGSVNNDLIDKIKESWSEQGILELTKSEFSQLVRDIFFIDHFSIENFDGGSLATDQESTYRPIVTLYRAGKKKEDLLKTLNISDLVLADFLDETTIRVNPAQFAELNSRYPFLIAMAVTDISRWEHENFEGETQEYDVVPMPDDEPVIGVLDTGFDESVYFSHWVESSDEFNPALATDRFHGTAIASLIVDGPRLNPQLEDHCGRFRVRHFGVTPGGMTSSFDVIRIIRKVVAANRTIKVWNLSLGSVLESPENFISSEGAELDRLQKKYDVIFVVSGTNSPPKKPVKKIGAPADSINSIVVNAVNSHGKPASYSRSGPVLSFFNKPDIACFGGDEGQLMNVYSSDGYGGVSGTSFAAPWISRKLAFLIYQMGLSREVAKALLIDSAIEWNGNAVDPLIGYGVVPVDINKILHSRDDEIRFIIQGKINSYESYDYELPVPIIDGKFPYIAKATMCYFPDCDRSQGVDYTDTELDFKIGRMDSKNGKPLIDSLNHNRQNQDKSFITESEGRNIFRKWDNVKHISDGLKSRMVPRKMKGSNMWGISIGRRARITSRTERNVAYGIVVTLRATDKKNRIDDFERLCKFHQWFVNHLNIEQKIDLYQKLNQEVEFADDDSRGRLF